MTMLSPISLSSIADAQFEQDVSRRLEALESRQTQQAQQSRVDASSFLEAFVFSGLVQVQAHFGETQDNRSTSDLRVDTVELGMAAALNSNVSAELVLLYEEGETDLGVDVATLTFREMVGDLNGYVGKQYLPFGAFETALVNDTLVLELAEINKTAVQVGSRIHHGEWGAYLFDGDVDRENHVENWGLTFARVETDWQVGVDYLSSLAESDGFATVVDDTGLILEDSASAITLSGQWTLGELSVLGEYLTSLGTLQYDDGLNGIHFKPRALQLELDYTAAIQQQAWTFAIAWQQTENVAGFIPRQRFSVGGATDLFPGVSTGMEFWYDTNYSESDGGSGENSMNLVVQISAEF